MIYLLDSNVFSDLMRKSPHVEAHLVAGRCFLVLAVAGNGDVFVVNSTEKRIVVWQAPQ